MALLALGPLHLSHENLWTLTWGELEDLIHAWSYTEYLETRKRAQHAAWILNGSGNLKTPVRVDDLAGRWVGGRVMTEKQYREHLKRKMQEKKRRRGGDT
jgi:hypothetical protein